MQLLAVFEFYYCMCLNDNLNESENLQNSDSPFCLLFGDFRLCSHYNFVNYST